MATTSPQIWAVGSGPINVGLTNTFIAPVAIDITSNPITPAPGTKISANKFVYKIQSIVINVDTIAAGATGLTLRISPDSSGDKILVPDTTATFAFGITTPTKGGVAYKADIDLYVESPIFYWSLKTTGAGGTCNVRDVTILLEKN